jgi:hypothetical protein
MSDTASRVESEKDPVYKDGRRRSVSLSRFPKAAADIVGGICAATADGFTAFSEELNDDNLLRVGVDNGVISGSAVASREFFQRLAKVSDDVYQRIREYAPAREPIDVDALAQKVAALIQKGTSDKGTGDKGTGDKGTGPTTR